MICVLVEVAKSTKIAMESSNMKRIILDFIETALSSLVVLMVLYMTIALPEMVWGSSMEPNFHSEERILVDRISKVIEKDFKRGEVVVFKPEGSSKHLIKRIIGIPGDIFKVYDCKVYVSRDGEKFKLEETYLDSNVCTKGGSEIQEGRSIKIEPGTYVALGDNRDVSYDSRFLGVIKEDQIVGRVVFRFWPLSKMGFIK